MPDKANSKIDLTPKHPSTREGQSVVFEAIVTCDTGEPAGTVTFSSDQSTSTVSLNASGIAVGSLSGLTWGTHTISAVYSGNEQIDGSNKTILYEVRRGWAHIQHIFTVVALCVGALWAGYTFFTQRQDRIRSEQAALEMTLSAQQETTWYPEATTAKEEIMYRYLIQGEIHIKNVGNTWTNLKLDDGPLFIAKVENIPHGALPASKITDEDAQNGKMVLGDSKKIWLARPLVDEKRRPDIENIDQIRPGATDVFHFMVRVDSPGLYAILFSPGAPTEKLAGLPYPPRWEPPVIFVRVRDLDSKINPSAKGPSRGRSVN